MLERLLEPEVMDTAAAAAEYDAMDFEAVNQDFARGVLSVAPVAGQALDVGTGPGRIPIMICERRPGLQVLGTDLSKEMLKLAAAHVEQAGLQKQIRFRCLDAKALDLDDASFDLIFSNSIIHHIPEPLTVFREISRVLKPGAAVFLRDLCRPDTETELKALVERHASDCNAYQKRLFRESLRASLTLEEIQGFAADAGLTKVQVTRTSDRHWTLSRPRQ